MSAEGSRVSYAEILRLAAAEGLQELDCTIVQVPDDTNGHHAVMLATVRTARALYRAVGEATRDALPVPLHGHVLMVAEERAKTRALAEAVGIPEALEGEALPGRAAQGSSGERQARVPAPDISAAPPVQARLTEVAPITAQAVGGVAAKEEHHAPSEAPAVSAGPAEEVPDDTATRSRPQPARPVTRPVPAPKPSEGLGPDILGRLLQMTRRKAVLEGAEISEEEAMRKLDSFFQRAFGHPLSDGTRMEGQRVVQRLASDISRLSSESDDSAYAAG